MNKTNPLIVHSPLSCTWFVLTRYKRENGAVVTASVKYDVTDQMLALASNGMLKLPRCCARRYKANHPTVAEPTIPFDADIVRVGTDDV